MSPPKLPPAPLLMSLLFIVVPAAVFASMVVAIRIGRRIGARRMARPAAGAGDAGAGAGAGAVEAALFGLLGLLVGFSFSGAQTRLDARRAMVVEEANAIGTAYLRLDLLPEPQRRALQGRFKAYVDARITFYRELLDFEVAAAMNERARSLQQEIWTGAIDAAGRAADMRAALLVVPALNAMFDVTSARDAALRTHVPAAIFLLLGFLSFGCAVLAGVDMAWNHDYARLYTLAFAGALSLTAYVILNIEFPRLGFVRFEALDALLVQVRAGMG